MHDSTLPAKHPKVLIADDHAIVAEALRSLLCDQYEIVGFARDGPTLISKAREFAPDLIVSDIGMPVINGLDAAERLKHSMPNVRFVFLTMMDDPQLAAAALRFAPVGYVLKQSAADELVTAMDYVLHGRSFVTRTIKREPFKRSKAPREKILKQLTPRQQDVVRLLVRGSPMKEVADVLQISEKTVEYHKYEVMRSFNLKSTAELVLFALKNGLISGQ